MASLSNINGLFDVHSTGAILFSTSHGTSGQILKSNGNAAPTWVDASTVIGGPYLPLSGGTLTGATATASGISFTVGGVLTGTTATFSGNVTANAYLTSNGSLTPNSFWGTLITAGTGSYADFALLDSGTTRIMHVPTGTRNVAFESSVGIGKDPDAPLVVYRTGDVWHTVIGNDTGQLRIGGQTGNGAVIQSRNQAGTVFRDLYLQRDGKGVGIGTNQVYQKLQINGSGNNWITSPSIRLWDTLYSKGWLVGNVNNATAGDFYIRTLPSVSGNPDANVQKEFVIKHATGYIGVGTLSPSAKLDVYQGNIRRSGISSGSYLEIGDLPGYGANAFASLTSGGTIHFSNNGKYCAYLEGGNTYFGILNSSTQTTVFLNTSGNSYLTGGNLGIGVSTPDTPLAVYQTGDVWHAKIGNDSGQIRFGGQTGSGAVIQSRTNTGTSRDLYIQRDGGRVGIGVNSTPYKLTVADAIDNWMARFENVNSENVAVFLAHASGYGMAIDSSENDSKYLLKLAGGTGGGTGRGSQIRMIVQSNGNVGIGMTSPTAKIHVDGTTSVPAARFYGVGGTIPPLELRQNNTAGWFAKFYSDNFGTYIGGISFYGSSTTFNTSSDYRLKENIIPMSDSISRLKKLKPSRFNFKQYPEITIDGFLAHEVQNVVPEAVTGNKDELDSSGEPVYQAIDHSRLVPLLVAAIQELEARVKELENK